MEHIKDEKSIDKGSVETSEHNVKNEKLDLIVNHQNFKIGAMESELIEIRK